MFHRAPSISFVAVITTALIFLLVTLFASPLSSPGAAFAEDSRTAAFDQKSMDFGPSGALRIPSDDTNTQDFDGGPSA